MAVSEISKYLETGLLEDLLIGSQVVGVEERGSGSDPEAPSVEELYRRVATEVTRPGYVYHEVRETEIHDEQGDRKGTSEVWVDTSRDRARGRTSQELTGRDEITVVIAEGRAFSTEYSDSQDHGDQGFDVMAACHGVSAAVTFVMEGIAATGCIDDGSRRLEKGQHDGKAVVLLTRGPRGDYAEWTERLYFDRSTFLPVADEVEAIAGSGKRRLAGIANSC